MGNIVRWFEDFPNRVLDLLPIMKSVAADRDRIGSLSLLIAPALIVAPYERLQTHDRRNNPQEDYLRFSDAHRQFNAVMEAPFCEAAFWNQSTIRSVVDWRGSKVARVTSDPAEWKTPQGRRLLEDEFWTVNVSMQQTRWVWKFLRDALAHWNVANADRSYRCFDEGGTMERFLFYRAHDRNGPWDVVSVSPEAFLVFLEAWTIFLSQGLAGKLLAESEAA
jgi:hypothetical protein